VLDDALLRYPIRRTLSNGCASAASGAARRPRVRLETNIRLFITSLLRHPQVLTSLGPKLAARALLRLRRPPLSVMAFGMDVSLFVPIARLARGKAFRAHATGDRHVVSVLRRHVSPPWGRGGWGEEQASTAMCAVRSALRFGGCDFRVELTRSPDPPAAWLLHLEPGQRAAADVGRRGVLRHQALVAALEHLGPGREPVGGQPTRGE
jgi:hypothetical protein